MKILIIIFSIIFGVVVVNAQTFNDPVSNSGNIQTKVIRQFSITNIQTQTTIPDVIKGQIRPITPNQALYLFKIEKEYGYTITFNFVFPSYPVNGVKINADWLVSTPADGTDYNLDNLAGWEQIPQTGQWYWFGGGPTAFAWLKIYSIDATNATTTGIATFVVNASGSYYNI